MGQMHVAKAIGQVLRVDLGDLEQMQSERAGEAVGQHRHPVLCALAVANDDFAASEFDVLYAKAHRFEDPHAGAIEEATDQMVDVVQMAQDTMYFAGGQDDRETDWTFG